MRLLPISLLLLLAACGASPVRDLPHVAVTRPTFQVRYFSDAQTDYVYKANITVYGRELSGICIIKKIDGGAHRVVLTTEFGNKLVDLEVSESNFKVNAVVEELDRKMLIRILVNDFRVLLGENYQITQQFEDTEYQILQSPQARDNNFLYVSKSSGKLGKIVQASKRKPKMSIGYLAENDIFAHRIAMEHYDIPLKIEFQHFKNQ